MRISNISMYQNGLDGIQKQVQLQLDQQTQLSTGQRILKPSDDPVASARGLMLQSQIARNTLFQNNAGTADDQLQQLETYYTAALNNVQSVHDLAIQAGNPTVSDANLQALAKNVEGQFQALLGVANTKDAQGKYVFSGYQGNTQPYVETSDPLSVLGTVSYAGDQGTREIQVSPSRSLAVSDPGSTVFDSMFSTLKKLHDVLVAGRSSPTFQADLTTSLNQLDTAQTTVSTAISGIGAKRQELQSIQDTGSNLDVQYQSELSGLYDVDYAATISAFTQSQQLLEVARQTYQKVQGLSLFNYLSS